MLIRFHAHQNVKSWAFVVSTRDLFWLFSRKSQKNKLPTLLSRVKINFLLIYPQMFLNFCRLFTRVSLVITFECIPMQFKFHGICKSKKRKKSNDRWKKQRWQMDMSLWEVVIRVECILCFSLTCDEKWRKIDKISDQSIQSIKFDELCARISMHFYRFRRSLFFSWMRKTPKTRTNFN